LKVALENSVQPEVDDTSSKELELDKVAYAESDNEFAEKMQKARVELFKNFKYIPQELLAFTTFISGSSID